jgi:hypothetical protein
MKEKLSNADFKTDNFYDELNKGIEKNWNQLQETLKNVPSPLH